MEFITFEGCNVPGEDQVQLRILMDTNHLANLVWPCVADLTDHAIRAAALLILCMGRLAAHWDPVIMNGACIAQMLKVTELIENTRYSQQEMLDSL